MRTLYQASNSLEAHMLQDLLQMEGITARIDGEYLQGGMGELPATGLVRVMVDEEDYQAAKVIVDRWDAAQPPQSPQAQHTAQTEPVRKLPIFLAGIAVGFFLALLLT